MKEAKDSVARFAMKCDVLNAGRKAREAVDLSGAGEDLNGKGASLENIETRTNPFAIVFHGLKKLGVVPVITYLDNNKSGKSQSAFNVRGEKFRINDTSYQQLTALLFGATLSVTIGLRESKVYQIETIYLNPKEAKVQFPSSLRDSR